jgi:hypothetical protein
MECLSLAACRQKFTQSLRDLSIIEESTTFQTSIIKALKDQVGTELFCDLCQHIIEVRKVSWETELEYLMDGSEVASILMSLRCLFI